MWTKDSQGREIHDGDTVTWSGPPHIGGAYEGEVVGTLSGGWFAIRIEGRRRLEPVKPIALTVRTKPRERE